MEEAIEKEGRGRGRGGRGLRTGNHTLPPSLIIHVQASRCNVLGKFDMVGLPPAPAGTPKIEVTYYIDSDGVLTVSALDLNTQRQEQWLRQGHMAAQI